LRVSKFIARGVCLYLIVVFAFFLFSLASMRFDMIARLENRIAKPDVAFVLNETIHMGELEIDGEPIDTDNLFATRVPDDLREIDVWVFALNGFDEIKGLSLAKDLGLDVAKISTNDPDHVVRNSSVSLSLRLHPLPIYMRRQTIVVFDIEHMLQRNRRDCFGRLIYLRLKGEFDKVFSDACRVVPEASDGA